MGRRAKAGTVLPELVKLAIPTLQEAQRQSPRTGPGAKPVIPDWVMAAMIMIALLSKKKTKSAQYRYLHERRRDIGTWLGCSKFPSRATYFRRYRRTHRLYGEAIRLQGQQALAEGIADPEIVAADKSLLEAQGPAWHTRQRHSGKIPAGVDGDTTWGYSEHHGWVQGYSFEVVVTATPGSLVFPLCASVATASASETRTFEDKIDQLPDGTTTVLVDSGYDANRLGERVEFDAQGERTGRRFVCPPNPRNNKRMKTKPGGADASRAQSRHRRNERIQYYKSREGRRVYARRSKTVEPFNQWFKSLFELDGRVWHRGLNNNQTQILGAIYLYQLLVRYNHRCGNENGQLRWILDTM
jgi:hypothetical protein